MSVMTHTASTRSPRTPAGLAAQDLTTRGMVTLAVVTMAGITALDLIDGRIGVIFSLGFVLVVVTTAMAVDVRELFPAGVLPPVLLFATLLLLSIGFASAVAVEGADADAGLITRFLGAVIDHGLTLVVGHGLAIAVIVWRILRDT